MNQRNVLSEDVLVGELFATPTPMLTFSYSVSFLVNLQVRSIDGEKFTELTLKFLPEFLWFMFVAHVVNKAMPQQSPVATEIANEVYYLRMAPSPVS